MSKMGKANIDIAEYIVKTIIKVKGNMPVLIAFDGVDTSGKTTLADNVMLTLSQVKSLNPIRLSIDKFHNPRKKRIKRGELSPEGFFYDSFNYQRIINNVINPVKSAAKYIIPGCYDYKTESKINVRKIPVLPGTIVLFDGIFLNRDELYTYWDLSIFLDIKFETVLKRALIRDIKLFGSEEEVRRKYLNRYIPGEKIYLNQANPKKRAHIVIDNNDYNNPEIIKEWVD